MKHFQYPRRVANNNDDDGNYGDKVKFETK